MKSSLIDELLKVNKLKDLESQEKPKTIGKFGARTNTNS